MSKVGRKPISLEGITADIKGQEISYKGAQDSGVHVLPDSLSASIEDNMLTLSLKKSDDVKSKNVWGLHRALLNNKISGSREKFKKEIKIIGLGYKGTLQGNKIEFALGYSHKILFDVPENVEIAIDKSGQNVTVISSDKFLAGDVAQKICALRAPEPYKGTGVRLADQVVHRKAGKTKGD